MCACGDRTRARAVGGSHTLHLRYPFSLLLFLRSRSLEPHASDLFQQLFGHTVVELFGCMLPHPRIVRAVLEEPGVATPRSCSMRRKVVANHSVLGFRCMGVGPLGKRPVFSLSLSLSLSVHLCIPHSLVISHSQEFCVWALVPRGATTICQVAVRSSLGSHRFSDRSVGLAKANFTKLVVTMGGGVVVDAASLHVQRVDQAVCLCPHACTGGLIA